jgi:hypothetical protein
MITTEYIDTSSGYRGVVLDDGLTTISPTFEEAMSRAKADLPKVMARFGEKAGYRILGLNREYLAIGPEVNANAQRA